MSCLALYLHGFASSPGSSKAIRLAGELEAIGVRTLIPDLNQPVFRTLTITRMVGQVRDAIDAAMPAGPVVLIGSSLGAFVAVHAAAGDPRVNGLVLLAPALDFGADAHGRIGTVTIEDWKREGAADVFHYAWNRPERLDYALYEDARRYDAFALTLDLPVLVFQGARDTVVDPEAVRRWASSRANVTLRMVDDDHQLQASLDLIASESTAFVSRITTSTDHRMP